MKTEAATKANYTVKNIEVVAKGAEFGAHLHARAWRGHSLSSPQREILITTLYYMARSPLIRGNQIMSTF